MLDAITTPPTKSSSARTGPLERPLCSEKWGSFVIATEIKTPENNIKIERCKRYTSIPGCPVMEEKTLGISEAMKSRIPCPTGGRTEMDAPQNINRMREAIQAFFIKIFNAKDNPVINSIAGKVRVRR